MENGSDRGTLRSAAAPLLAALAAACVALPFVLTSFGPTAYRQPGEFEERKAKPPATAATRTKMKVQAEPADLETLSARLRATVDALVDADGSGRRAGRSAGSPRAEAAADYIAERFRAAGLQNVAKQAFPLATPASPEGKDVVLSVEGGKPCRLLPLSPNLVRTCTLGTPGNRIKAPLVWGSDGRLANLRGKDLAGAILVLQDDQGYDWLTAGSLGAAAIIFVEPADPKMLQPDLKVLTCTLDIPRFWLPRAEWEAGLRERLQAPGEPPQAELFCRVDWAEATAYNVFGLIPGTDPEKSEDVTLVTAYYDSASIVPGLSPGAESAASVAALLELVERLRQAPPQRPVLFLATGAHVPGMAGERQAAELLRRPVGTLLKEIGELDGPVLGQDSAAVLAAAGQQVSGLRPWQRVLLIVLVLLAAAGAVTVSATMKLKVSRAAAVVAVATLGMTLLCVAAGFWLGRPRRVARTTEELSSEQKDEKRWQEAGSLRDAAERLSRARPEWAEQFARIRAATVAQKWAERKAIVVAGRLKELISAQEKGDKWADAAARQAYAETARELHRAVLRAADADPMLAAATRELLGCLGRSAGEDASLEALRTALREELQTARDAKPRLFRLVNACSDALDEVEERLKVNGADRLKYLRLAGYAAFLGEIGPDMPERVKSCIGIDLSSHSERMALFFKGLHFNHHIDRDEKKLQAAVNLLAAHISEAGSAHARALRWAPPDETYSAVVDTTETLAGQDWKELAPGTPYFSSEAFMLSGIPSITFGTAMDARPLANTPMDLPGAMDFDKLARQVEILCRTLVGTFRPGPPELAPRDVRSWPALARDLSADAPGAAEAVRKLLPADALGVLAAAERDAEVSPADQAKVADAFNALIAGGKLLDAALLAGMKLEGEARTLRDRLGTGGELTPVERRRLGRLVLDAAVPQLVGLTEREAGLTALERVEAECDFKRGDWLLRISGQIIEYNPAKSRTLSVTPVAGAVVFHRREPQQYRDSIRPSGSAVWPQSVTITDRFGAYEIFGVAGNQVRFWSDTHDRVLAYEVEPETGNIVKAPDEGTEGKKYPAPWRGPKKNEDNYIVVTFPCQVLNIFEATDLRSYETSNTQFDSVIMFKGAVDEVPINYGWSLPGPTSGMPYPEPAVALFIDRRPPATGTEDEAAAAAPGAVQLKFTFGRARLAGVRWPVLGVPPGKLTRETHTGLGLPVTASARLTDPDRPGVAVPLSVVMAQDLYRLDGYRMAVLEDAGVKNKSLVEQHNEAGREMKEMLTAKEMRLWDDMVSRARSSWGFEARGYPNIQSTVTDVVKGLLFYLFLMLPFAYFAERLIFAFPDINRQIFGVFGTFMVSFAVLYAVHPAFGITSSAPMILLSFVTMALAILVISMISSRFKRELEAMQHRPGRSRKADMDRFNAAISAFLLGINNMRRRKVRTLLTMATLVLLTFSVLSFSSIESTLGANRRPLTTATRPPYAGVLVRNEGWLKLDESAARQLRDEFGRPERNCAVSPRCWSDKKMIRRADAPEISYLVPGMLGVREAETEVTRLGSPEMLVCGRFFTEKEVREKAPVCLLDEALMTELKLDPRKVTSSHDPKIMAQLPHITVGGEPLAIIGVLRTAAYAEAVDLDGERIVPVDQEAENWQRRRGKGAGSQELEFRSYQHVLAHKVPVVPYDWLMDRGGTLYSVALMPRNQEDRKKASEEASKIAEEQLLRRISVPMFLATEDKGGELRTEFMSTAATSNVSGVGSLLVPMLIAALIVLNTMLGSVYEREGEISIYGSLGLAPVHIGSLFIAESAVYAVISSVLGYILGQSVAKLVVIAGAEGLLAGFSLNYSSLSAVFSACFIIAVVMFSAAYPAYRAGQLSVPDVERIWKFPEPEGDRLVFDFPFTVAGEQALGINVHLKHYFEDHANQSVGEFYTADTVFGYLRTAGEGENPSYRLSSRVWIAPFDFGISQDLELETYPEKGEVDVYQTRMTLTRLSGSPDSWVKMNHRFMKSIRKQFLLWRLFTPEERAWHARQARVLLGELSPEEAEAEAGTTLEAAGAEAG